MTFALVAVAAAVVALVVYGLFAWEHIIRRRRAADPTSDQGSFARASAARPSAEPDAALAFARGRTWIAVRGRDVDAFARALSLRTVLPANWRSGLGEVGSAGVFVTPPVAGWMLAVGPDLRVAPGSETDVLGPLLGRLSELFGEAAWFTTDAQADRHGWAVAARGDLLRGYSYDGDLGTVFFHGDVTPAERDLGCFVDDPRDRSDDDEKWWPDERIVLELAAAWTVDPRRLPELAAARSVGRVGRR